MVLQGSIELLEAIGVVKKENGTGSLSTLPLVRVINLKILL